LIRNVTSGYFAVTRVPLVEGRVFSAADTASSPKVVVVNATLARRYFGRSRLASASSFSSSRGSRPGRSSASSATNSSTISTSR
jgi:hypothetical protein